MQVYIYKYIYIISIYMYTYLIFNDIYIHMYMIHVKLSIHIYTVWQNQPGEKNAKHLLCTSQSRSCSSSSSKWPSQSNSRDALDAWPPIGLDDPDAFSYPVRWRTPIVEIAFKMAFQWLMRPPKSCWIMIAKPFDCVEKNIYYPRQGEIVSVLLCIVQLY